MTTLNKLRSQIENLRKQEQAILRKEKKAVIARLKKEIDAYQITASELGLSRGRGEKAAADGAAPAPKKRGTRKRAERVVKYRKGDLTWTGGRGRKPQWVTDALAAGEDLEQYRVG